MTFKTEAECAEYLTRLEAESMKLPSVLRAAAVDALPEAVAASAAEERAHKSSIRNSHHRPKVPSAREYAMNTERLMAGGDTLGQATAKLFNSASAGKPLAEVQPGPKGGIGVDVKQLPSNPEVDCKISRPVRVRVTKDQRIEVIPAENSTMDRDALVAALRAAGFQVVENGEDGMPVFNMDPNSARMRSTGGANLMRQSDGSVVAYAPPVRIR
jgi:hypothetical protein